MRDLFLADAHLIDPADGNYRKMLDFLEKEAPGIRTLYLLGDIFEFWVGYRHSVFSAYVPLLESLRKLREKGTEIVFVEGNHDFHLGPYFEKTLGCRILPDGGAVEIDGLRVFVEHGDLVNAADRGYRLLRAFLRSRPARGILSLCPPDWSWAIARRASRLSQKKRPAKIRRWQPADLLKSHAHKRFEAGADAVVTGHFHTPVLHRSEGKTLVALGDWITQYSYAVFENGAFRLERF
jgi:UDP-2,3-diacylglucosamine hydrolase